MRPVQLSAFGISVVEKDKSVSPREDHVQSGRCLFSILQNPPKHVFLHFAKYQSTLPSLPQQHHPWFKLLRGGAHQDQASDGDAGDHISGDDLHILLFPVREAQRTLTFNFEHKRTMVQSGDQVAISCDCLEEDAHDPWYHIGISSDIQKNQTLQTMNPSLASTQ